VSLTLAGILRDHVHSYTQLHRQELTGAHYRALRAILSCRTPAMGGRVYTCKCGQPHYSYHSCNHRSCPSCGSHDQAVWSAQQEAKLLPGVTYYMITFTLPEQLRPAIRAFQREGYTALLKNSAQALKDVIATKYQDASMGCTSVLHTWGRQVQYHPHVHLIVPALALKGNALVESTKTDSFLVHFRPLADRFRTLMRTSLQEIEGLTLSTDARIALSPATQWNVQVKPVGAGKTALRYLARYVTKTALSNERLLGYTAEGKVRLQWTCSTTNRNNVMELHPHELIRRVLQHVLPKGLTRVRHYGYLSPAAIKKRLLIRALLGELGEPAPIFPELPPMCCNACGGELTLVRILKAPRPPTSWKL